VIQYHPGRPLPNLRGKLVRRLAHRKPSLSGVKASGNPGAVQGIDRAAHLSKIAIPMIFIAGSRDALAETDLLCPVVSDLGNQSRLHIVDHADHSFKVAKKSGRTTADAEAEALDALAGWISNII